jgi:hypothetical protein
MVVKRLPTAQLVPNADRTIYADALGDEEQGIASQM